MEFNFYNGAMTKYQCNRMKLSLKKYKENIIDNLRLNEKSNFLNRNILILSGSISNWSNGLNLNVIENSENPEEETYENLLALNEVIKEIINLKEVITISAVQSNAGSGGVFLALASDFIFLDEYIQLLCS